ncbi:MAG TPA: PAS domain-containing protein [Mycobacteriales bacterium]|nr:PAS domain-containing protein [Mycobacteriales bacterium]
MPRLILRLEPLAREGDAAEQEDVSEEPADSGGWQSTSTAVREAVAASAATSGEPATEPTTEPAASRRIFDLAAAERLATAGPLSRWSAAVAAAHDACLVLDGSGIVVSVAVAAVELLGCGDRAVIGHHLLGAITLIDFETGATDPEYADRITPLAVLDAPGLARSILRVRHDDGSVVTLDTSSAPIHDVTGSLIGSVTFLAPIPSR